MSLKAVLLAGGALKGTRFRPLSLERPKPLFPVAGFPTIQHHIEKLSKVDGLGEILILGFYPPADILPFVTSVSKNFPNINIRYLQEFTALGTAGGIHHFRDQILMGNPEAIFVVNADVCGDLPLKEMVAFRAASAASAACVVLVTEATRAQSLNYGCLVVAPDDGRVLHYVEKPATFVSALINCGVYLLGSSIFPRLADVFAAKARLASPTNGDAESAETIWFERDIFPHIAGSEHFYAFKTERWWSQIKTASAAIYANRHCLRLYASEHPERLSQDAENGPQIIGDVYIHPTAHIDPSAVMGPNVSVGVDAVVRAGARVRESIVLERAEIGEHAVVLFTVVDGDSVVGPWARVEGTPAGPNPNMPFAKLESKALFLPDGRLNPAITILGRNVTVPRETIILNSIVLPHKELSGSYKNQIIL